MHRHGAIPVVCEAYGTQVLGIQPDDRCLSSSKAFFAYGLGNSVLFPMSVGVAAVLEPSPSRPEIMAERAGFYAATLFFAGPTFFASMLQAGLRLLDEEGNRVPDGTPNIARVCGVARKP